MIKTSALYPFQGFLRTTQEFHEDKACVKIKALTFEREYEFEYRDVAEISDVFSTNYSQMSFSFWALLAETLGIIYFCNYLYSYPVLLQIARVLFVSTLISLILCFKKKWSVLISDKNDNLLAKIDQTRQNSASIPKITQLIKEKSDNLVELSVTDPYPKNEPIFEQTEFNYTQFSKTTERFYEDKIIGHQRSIYSEFVYQIRYDQISKKIHRGKKNKDISGDMMLICGAIIFPLMGLYFLFDINLGKQILCLLYTMAGVVIISIPFSLLKREMIALLNNEGKILYWTFVNRKNKASIEELIKFIRSKIPIEEKN